MVIICVNHGSYERPPTWTRQRWVIWGTKGAQRFWIRVSCEAAEADGPQA